MKLYIKSALVAASFGLALGDSSAEDGVSYSNECIANTSDASCGAVVSGEGELSGLDLGVNSDLRQNETKSDCADFHSLCAKWAEDGQCNSNQRLMLHRCMKSCNVCGDNITDVPVDEEPCVDKHHRCPHWKQLNQCEQKPYYMLFNCRKSCKACATSITSTIDFGVRQKDGGENALQVAAVIRESKKYMRKVMADPEYASARETCRNSNEMCSMWAAAGECQKNPSLMKFQCAPACQTCLMLDESKRCEMDPNAKDALGPGDLHKMFERIVDKSEGSEFAKYNATIISRPYKSGDTSVRTWKLGPWFLSFDNFLSDEESERLIQHGVKRGFGRSEIVSKNHRPDSSYEIIASSIRTSYNSWCDDDCQADPVIRGVIDRIAHLTGIPEENTEALQILQYEEGQKYGEHADYIPYQRNRPCGPRVLTLFLYLNDDFEGGETKFRFLHNMMLVPKKGRAVLWPNVLNKNPNEEDKLFDHSALAVTRGTKYAANSWLHLRVYRNAGNIRCA